MEFTQEITNALHRLVTIPDDRLDRFLACLSEADADPSLERVTTAVARAAQVVSLEDVRHLVALGVYLYSREARAESMGADVAMHVAQLFLLQVRGSGSSDEESVQALQGRISRLMSASGAVNLIAKSDDVWRELPRRLVSARVITDVRPVFADGPTLEPAASLIVHTLCLSFYEGQDLRHFHVSLDRRDLRTLASVVDRAQRKEVALSELLKDTKMPAQGPKSWID